MPSPPWRVAAAKAAGTGIAVLRFDYGSTGDSAGQLGDDDQVADWIQGIQQAIGLARSLCSGPVLLIGLRVGALLASTAIERGAAADGLVLWDPIWSGRSFLRLEQTALATGYGASQPEDGSIAGPAFTYSPKTAADLSALDLRPAGPAFRPPCSAWSGGQATKRRHSEFEDAGAEWIEAEGFPQLFDVYPDDLVLPTTMIETLVGRLASGMHGPSHPIRFTPKDDALLVQNGVLVRERPLRLGPHRLFAMLTEPVEPDPGQSASTLIFLNAGALDHTGPGRQWVELARHFAAEDGLRSIRIDFDGLGETESRPGLARNVTKPTSALDDLSDMCKALDDSDANGLVVIGLSSGGYHAFELALRCHPRAACVINPGITGGTLEDHSGQHVDNHRLAYRVRPAPFRRLAVKHRRVSRLLNRAWLQVALRRSPHHPVAVAARRGIPILLILTEVDAGYFERSAYWSFVRRRLIRRGILEIQVVPGEDHSLYTPAGQEATYPILISWISEHYGARIAPTPPYSSE